jgi:hypothetical protein
MTNTTARELDGVDSNDNPVTISFQLGDLALGGSKYCHLTGQPDCYLARMNSPHWRSEQHDAGVVAGGRTTAGGGLQMPPSWIQLSGQPMLLLGLRMAHWVNSIWRPQKKRRPMNSVPE